MSSLTQCFLENSIINRIIILKPDNEFLMWELPPTDINSHQDTLDPLTLFRKHYLKAKNRDTSLSLSSDPDAEIIEAWSCSDKQVHEVYGKFCSQMLFRYHNLFELEHKLLNKIKLSKFNRKGGEISRNHLGLEYKEAAYRITSDGIWGNKRLMKVYKIKITAVADGKMIIELDVR
ncbi:9729_t:CDS:2, partial [Funneliformis caledonium]